jgi:hypothetical protein
MFKMSYKKITILDTTILLLTPIIAFAASSAVTNYVPLSGQSTVKALNQSGNGINVGNLSSFLGQVFNLGIAVAVVLALIMIIWGGIEYMTTDAFTGKSDGKKKITDALLGLGLALISWLLLYTINPCLVQFSATSGGCATTNQLVGK